MEFEWTEELATNVLWIDTQHKYIITEMQDILNAIAAGKGEQEIQADITLLEVIASSHFATEESYMHKYNFSGHNSHKTDHEKLGEIIERFKSGYEERGIYSGFTAEIKSALIKYWTDHIPNFDMPLAAFFKNRKM